MERAAVGSEWSNWTILSSLSARKRDRNRSVEKYARRGGCFNPVGSSGLGKYVADVPPDRVAGDE